MPPIDAADSSTALNGRVFALAGDAPTLASGMNISMLNLGNAAGPAIAGALISAHHDRFQIAPWSSIGFVGRALALVWVARMVDRHALRAPDQRVGPS
jgi:DHA1 family chloramphenicol resistance protein-like MFS transporter